jgi:beta-barrel assembly-enhancing protease
VKIVYTLLFFLCIPAALADGLPDLGEVAQTVLTPQDEQRIGEEILRDVATSDDVVNDIEVIDYLQALGYRLASNSPDNQQHFTFFVVRDKSINAFAMPGGVIGVHTGLILSTTSESELASVLAHEIGHVVQRHLARMLAQQQNDAWKSYAAMAFGLLAARSNPQLASASMQAAQASAVQRQIDYTREHEREADRVGLQILNQAGLDPRAMPMFFEQLMKGTRFSDGTAPSFLRSHPLTTERMADMQNRVDQIPYRLVVDGPEFHYVRAKLRAELDNPQQAIAMFEDNLREKKYSTETVDIENQGKGAGLFRNSHINANETAQHYGLALVLLRTNDLARARKEVTWLEDNAPRHAMIETLAANLEVAMGNSHAAAEKFKRALAIFPTHRGLIYGYAELLVGSNQAETALQFLDEKQRSYPEDAHLYTLKSQAYTSLGRQLLRHQAQGEAYYRSYNLTGAIEQMQLASKAGDGDFYQLSIVEARLKQLQQMAATEKK